MYHWVVERCMISTECTAWHFPCLLILLWDNGSYLFTTWLLPGTYKRGYLLVDKVAPCSTSSAPFIVIHQPTNYTMVVPLGLSLYGIFWNIVQWPSNKSNNVHIMVNATRIYMYVQDLSQKVLIKTGAQNIDTNNW